MNEKLLLIRATRIGGHAYRYLTARPRIGRVVSTFSGGINLLFEGGEAFVPVQTTTVPLHPWAIEIQGELLRFAEGTPVSVEGGWLSIGNVRITLSEARIEELSLPWFTAGEAAIAQHNFPILERFVAEARKTRPSDPFQQQIDTILLPWHQTADPDVLLDLIGLGSGSTPSGDDVLVGIVAGLSLFEGVNDQAKEALSKLCTCIRETARPRTPLPSAQMLHAACDRSFPKPLLALVGSLTREGASEEEILESAEQVARLGHHSGLAILSGLTKSRAFM